MPFSTPSEAGLLARYKENADQARHHETLRERTTTLVAQTVGVLLGLLGFKQGAVAPEWRSIVSLFIILLGLWGTFASCLFESRARRSRTRIDKIRAQLEPGFEQLLTPSN